MADDSDNSLPKGFVEFSGLGQAGNWSDPANWTGGVLPSAIDDTALITMSATLNSTFTAGQVMMLAPETVTINGTLNTLSPHFCTSMMVCEGATAIFTPTSTLNDAGGLIVGNDGPGVLVAQGSGSHHATLNTYDGKMGLQDGGNGSITINDAVWNNTGEMRVGAGGQGSLTVTNGGQVNDGSYLVVGADPGSVGTLTLSNGSHLSTAATVVIGATLGGHAGGTGAVTVSSGSTLSSAGYLNVAAHGALTLAGGTVAVADPVNGLQIAGGTLSGNGTVSVTAPASAPNAGINDGGVVTASGGTLTLNTSIYGTGQVNIGAGSTLAITGAHIGVPSIAFTGSNGTLALAHGIADHATITGFAAGDSILMAGVDHLAWNGTTDVLTLSSGSTAVDHLQFAGTYASNAFTLSQTSAGAMIGLTSTHAAIVAH